MNDKEYRLGASERRALLHTLTQNRLKLEKKRIQLRSHMRTLASEMESLERRISDTEQSIDYLESM